jgi:hypothetical protein
MFFSRFRFDSGGRGTLFFLYSFKNNIMYTGLVHLHNLLRWVIVITLIWSLLNAFKGKNGKETLIMLISSHVMLLIGLVQWFGGEWGLKQIKNLGMGEAMKNAAVRFFAVEHALMMVIAVVLMTIAHRSAKATKHNTKWLLLAALVIIVLMMPGPWRSDAALQRGLFPGM